MRVLRLLGFVICAGCGVSERPFGTHRQAIVGGTQSLTDSSVFMLDISGNNGATTRCSATLIAPRTLLTAAHCADPAMMGATSLTIIASNAPTAAEVMPGVNTVRVTQTRLHPVWNAAAAGLGGDLALLLLDSPQTIPPSPWSRDSLTSLGGEPVRAVGYGSDAIDAGTGTRRTVELTIRQLTPELIALGNFVDKGICHGDSGGPTFHTFGDGVERLIGVHSFTRGDDCLDGADTRLDAKAPFILQWLSEFEENCGANFVCAAGTCADPDCVALGQPCGASWDCRERQCINDAQHADRYCSKTCASDVDCTAGLRCDTLRGVCQRPQLPPARPTEPCLPGATFCLSGSVCEGLTPELARCSQPCTRTIDCLAPQICRVGFTGNEACLDPPPITLPVGRIELPAARGCSTSTGLAPLLVLAWWWRRRVTVTAPRCRCGRDRGPRCSGR